MEHRQGFRKPVRLAVMLTSQQGPELKGEILDFSVGGAFIRLQNDFSALRNIVHLRFRACLDEPDLCKCRALIVRNEKEGIGVMFDHRQEQAFEKIECALESSWPFEEHHWHRERPQLADHASARAAEHRH